MKINVDHALRANPSVLGIALDVLEFVDEGVPQLHRSNPTRRC